MSAHHSTLDPGAETRRLPGGKVVGASPASTPAAGAGPWLAVSELNHRVANEYAAAIAWLSIATTKVADPGAKAALIDAASRLHDFAEAHRALQPPLTAELVSLVEYLRRLCAALIRTKLADRGIGLRLVEHDIDLDADQCWRVGLIVSELVTNAARHAFNKAGGSIVVELGVRGGEVLCGVTDNGRWAADPRPGQGALIVDALATELGGGVERRFTPQGTIVLLRFPYKGRGHIRPPLTSRLAGEGELRTVG